MKRKDIIAAVIVLAAVAVVAAGYLYWKSKKSVQQPAAVSATSSVQSAVDAAGAITESATKGTLPSIGAAANPLKNKPDVNPVNKANPFKSTKINPFQ